MEYRHKLKNKIVMIGFGSVGQGILPMLAKYFDITNQLLVISPCHKGKTIAEQYGVPYHLHELKPSNYKEILNQYLQEGDFLLNLCVNVSSHDLIAYTQEKGCPYLDTSIEPWEGTFFDDGMDASERSNYAFREAVLTLRDRLPTNGPTAIVAHGANPGIVSSFIKRALLTMGKDTGILSTYPSSREDWIHLAVKLNIKTIHVSEYDWQVSDTRKKHNEFVNTWSIEGLHSEGYQPAELGWGTHERHWPKTARRHKNGCQAAIYLDQPGLKTEVKSWSPLAGQFKGYLISHNESIAIADYYTLKGTDGEAVYRPTIHYCYRPCDDAILSIYELEGRDLQLQDEQRLLRDDINHGIDELGVLLMGNKRGAYWFGSHLSIQQARANAPLNSATTMQIAVGALSGLLWALENPNRGILEPDDLDHAFILKISEPYLGTLTGTYTSWTPIQQQSLFANPIDKTDPWQFINFMVSGVDVE